MRIPVILLFIFIPIFFIRKVTPSALEILASIVDIFFRQVSASEYLGLYYSGQTNHLISIAGNIPDRRVCGC